MTIRILLVDNSRETLDSLSLLYGLHEDATISGVADDPHEALRILQVTAIDLVSIDIDLGTLNGLLLCAQIRDLFPDIYITICSVESASLNPESLSGYGAQYCLEKPVFYNDVCALLTSYKLLNRRKKRSARRMKRGSRTIELRKDTC